MSYHKLLLKGTRSKYLKFKNRLEKNISSGTFDSLSTRKKNRMVAKVEKFRNRLERLALSKPGAVVGSALSTALIPQVASAQTPNFYLQSTSGISVNGARDVVVANIDTDDDMEVIFATNMGGVIANLDGKDGYETDDPNSLDNATGFMFVGDIDGDTDLDLIFGYEGDGAYFFKGVNSGYGTFTTSSIGTLSTSSDIDLVDWDSDGDLDVILSSFGSSFEVLENDGAGNFTELTPIDLTRAGVRDIEFVDLDNDGDLDMLHVAYLGTVPYTGSVYAFENTTDGAGTPTFNLASPTIVRQQGYTRFDDIVSLDFDGDGDLDLFFERNGSSYGYGSRNNFVEGTPFSFTDVSVAYLSSGGQISASAVADFDADGDDDLILAGSSFNMFLRFDGSTLSATDGNLGGTIGNVYGNFDEIYAADLNGDDNLDLIAIDDAASSASIYRDDSAPSIGDFVGTTIIDENTPIGSLIGTLTFEDLQSDPVTATLVGDDASLFNLDEATGELTISSEFDWESQGSDLRLELDMTDGVKSRVQVGILKMNNLPEEGNGTFNETPTRIFGMRQVETFAAGDYDMDGDADLFVSSPDAALQNSVLQQNSGSFTDELIGSVLDQPQRSAIFYEGNSDLNLLIHDQTNDELRTMNQNSSGFTSYSTLLTGILSVESMVVGDFDGDLLIEAAVHVENSLNNEVVYTFENDGGSLSLSQTFLMNDPGMSTGLLDGVGEIDEIHVADFDGDGFEDLLAVTVNGDDVVFSGGLDLGAGAYGFESTFTSVVTQADGGESEVQVGDIDGDGSEDIAVLRWVDGVNYELRLDLHTNDGSGNFTLDQTIDLGGEYSADIALADINGDNTLDLVATVLQTEDIGGELQLSSDLKTYTNDGAGNFTNFQTFEDVGGEAFVMMDVDGDDDLDIVMQYDFTNSPEDEDQLKVYENVNVAPTAINLSQSSFNEHLPIDSQVGTVTIDDLNSGDTHAISFAEGDGTNDEHNSFFSLDGNILRVVKDVRHEDTNVLRILLSVYDGTNTFEQAFVLNVNDVNLAPTGIMLSSTSFDEGTRPGTAIATVSAIDPNDPDDHEFALALGDGTNDADNGSFILDGDQLYIADESSFETKPTYNIYLSVSDIDNTFEQAFVINVNDINQAPTGISLSATDFDEGTVPGSTVATLTAVDANVGDTHTFELSVGDGTNDADNASFVVEGNNLRITEASSFESKPSYNIHLTVSDTEGSFDQAFTLTVNDINQAPTGVTLSTTTFDEGTLPGTSIASFTAIDANAGDSHTFELSVGDGSNDADNSSFVIDGANLIITEESSFETKETYNIHVTVADQEGSFDQAFVINVNDVNQAPTGINLSSTSFDEGTAPGTAIATISAIDANAGDTHTFSLSTGDGFNDEDNASFVIDGANLIITEESKFETKATYSIHLTVADGEGSFDQAFVLSVTDVNQAPTGIMLSAISFDEGTPVGTVVANLSAVDSNAGDSHVFELSSGDGTNDADNAAFIVDGSNLIVVEESSFEDKATYNIYLTVSDTEGSHSEGFVISVNDINQAPTAITLSQTNIDEGTTPGATIATVAVTDPNAGDSHAISLVDGDGSNDQHNDLFLVDGNELILIGDVNFDLTQTLNIYLSADDGYQTFAEALTLTVNEVLGLEVSTVGLEVYPNPGANRLSISLQNGYTGPLTLKVMDLAGREIHLAEATKSSENWSKDLNMTNEQSGVYLVELIIEDKKFIRRWIKR